MDGRREALRNSGSELLKDKRKNRENYTREFREKSTIKQDSREFQEYNIDTWQAYVRHKPAHATTPHNKKNKKNHQYMHNHMQSLVVITYDRVQPGIRQIAERYDTTKR